MRDDRDEFLIWPWNDWKSGVSSTRLFGTRSGRFVPSIRDDRATSAVRARPLRERGHTALTAGSLAAALKAAAAEDLDRLINDLGRPDSSGLELMRSAARGVPSQRSHKWVRERRGHLAEPGGKPRRPSDQAHQPPEAGGDEPIGRLVRGSAMLGSPVPRNEKSWRRAGSSVKGATSLRRTSAGVAERSGLALF